MPKGPPALRGRVGYSFGHWMPYFTGDGAFGTAGDRQHYRRYLRGPMAKYFKGEIVVGKNLMVI